ncbi:SDR family oxidoreductase [Methanofollis aquaemaris]|uniref:SDR family oxidoreductase n=1 Tax=Methanofollis aquaemaris TaxID=126734 RepID=A0A8A3S8K0_9EURY|nr:SDR family oxidoreductase [Methanofollis aquaemaris]QSZ67896.1 SDR family oxidoreductase [Methanofollis aquaemaris]
MRYVVTGGAGFIGSHIAEVLSNEHEVVVIDDLSTGHRENIQDFDVEFVEGSVTDLPLLREIFRGADGVFHQAAIASVPKSVDDPLATHTVNETGTLDVLLAARGAGVKKVVFASSSAVYGEEPTLPKHEGMLPAPVSPYAISKLTGEHYEAVFSKLFGLKTVALRYFNVFGPRQDPSSQYSGVISIFTDRVKAGEPITIHGDGGQTRDFVYVADVVRANLLAMERDVTGVFNIARGRQTDLNTLARGVMEAAGREVPVEYGPVRQGDVRHSLADISRAREVLGWAPEWSLVDGLVETIRWDARSG